MDIPLLEQHLRQALEHIRTGERLVLRQRDVVAETKARGEDSSEAERLLAAFEDSQVMHQEHRHRLEHALKV